MTLLEKAALHHITMEHQMLSWINAPSPTQVVMLLVTNDNPIELFNQYLAARGKSEVNFCTRADQQGMKPHEVAYFMGDTVQTVLKNYFLIIRSQVHFLLILKRQ